LQKKQLKDQENDNLNGNLDTINATKLAKKNPSLYISLRKSQLVPEVSVNVQDCVARDEAIDEMDISRYSTLLKLKSGKSTIPQSLLKDGLVCYA
jgi:hypothetical protein